jgi:RNA polymerase sigma-70 factor (sigma-E family)
VFSADEPGFHEFVLARRGALLRTAYLLTGSHADAEDLVQAALVRCVPRWKRIADRPEPYVRQVLARESISRWRARRWREQHVAAVPEGPAAAVDADDRLALRQALRSLPPRQRAVIVLRYYEDLTERQTAAQLGIAVGTVKSQARDGLARLRELVPDLDEATYVAR